MSLSPNPVWRKKIYNNFTNLTQLRCTDFFGRYIHLGHLHQSPNPGAAIQELKLSPPASPLNSHHPVGSTPLLHCLLMQSFLEKLTQHKVIIVLHCQGSTIINWNYWPKHSMVVVCKFYTRIWLIHKIAPLFQPTLPLLHWQHVQ